MPRMPFSWNKRQRVKQGNPQGQAQCVETSTKGLVWQMPVSTDALGHEGPGATEGLRGPDGKRSNSWLQTVIQNQSHKLEQKGYLTGHLLQEFFKCWSWERF